MKQHYRPDPILFIRIQLENAWDAGDLEEALRMGETGGLRRPDFEKLNLGKQQIHFT